MKYQARVLIKGEVAMKLALARVEMSDVEFCAMTKTIRAITGSENLIGFLHFEDGYGNDEVVVVEYLGLRATGELVTLPEDLFDNLEIFEEVGHFKESDYARMC